MTEGVRLVYTISCDYDEFDPTSYRGIIIEKDGEVIHRINDEFFISDLQKAYSLIPEGAEYIESNTIIEFPMDAILIKGEKSNIDDLPLDGNNEVKLMTFTNVEVNIEELIDCLMRVLDGKGTSEDNERLKGRLQ